MKALRIENWRGKYWMLVDSARGRIVAEKIERKADAVLFSAVPEMLEALRFALEQLESGYEVTGGSNGDGIGLEAISVVKAAIAKAEGK